MLIIFIIDDKLTLQNIEKELQMESFTNKQ
jgi:hypothetical protein